MTSTHDRIARGTRALLGLAAAVSLGFEGNFAGCGGPVAPSGPVPDGPRGDCIVDSDCAAMMCNVARCVANRCVMAEAVVDADRDGHNAMPCGDDCDDRSPERVPGLPERCDLVDNDCDERVDEGAPASFLVGTFSSSASLVLAAAPITVGATPGILFISNFGGRSLEARWLDPNSALLALASVADSGIGLADARDLGDGRAEVVWSTTTTPVTLRRAVLRVTATPTTSILIESSETVATLPDLPRALQLEGDANGSAILVDAGSTFLVLPGQAPIALAAPTAFDLAVTENSIVIPGGSGVLNFYNRDTGAVSGSVMLGSALSVHDAIVVWGTRLFAFSEPQLFAVDPVTMRVAGSPVRLDTTGPVSFGALADELAYVDDRIMPRGLDAMLSPVEHAFFSVSTTGDVEVFGLGSHLTVVAVNPSNTTYQVEQCGN